MTLAVTGSESFSVGTNPATYPVSMTVPAGTTGIAVTFSHAYTTDVQALYAGSVATSGAQLADSGNRGAVYGRKEAWWIDDIRGRSDDTLYITLAGTGAATSGYIIYFSANVPLEQSSAANGVGSGPNWSYGGAAVPVSGGNSLVFGGANRFAVTDWATTSGTGLNSGFYLAFYKVGAADEATEASGTASSGGFQSSAMSTIYESVVVPNVAPDPLNPLFQFGSGTIQLGSNAAIDAAAMRAFELKFNAGTFSTLAKRQVALVGEGIETSEMTEGGSEGDILTQHDNRPPTWESASGHAHGYSGELLITDTPAGTPLVFADILQNESEDDLLYEDVNP